MIYVLYGPPGVGKTYVGNLIAKHRDLQFFDADVLFNKKLVFLLESGSYNQSMRDMFVSHLIGKVEEMLIESDRDLVIAEAFTSARNRREFFEYFDKQVVFIYVTVDKELAKLRMRLRKEKDKTHPINEKTFERLWDEFEVDQWYHGKIVNDRENDVQYILKQFDIIRKKVL